MGRAGEGRAGQGRARLAVETHTLTLTHRDPAQRPSADRTVGPEAHGLVVVDRNLPVDVLSHQHLHDRALDLTEEPTGVREVLRHDDEAVVIQHEAVHFLRLARLAVLVVRTALEIRK